MRTPHTGISKTFLFNSCFCSFSSVCDGDRTFDSPVQHVHGGGYSDVITEREKGGEGGKEERERMSEGNRHYWERERGESMREYEREDGKEERERMSEGNREREGKRQEQE